MNEVQLLRIRLDGVLVAEADVTVYDEAKAWFAFEEALPYTVAQFTAELINVMRVATGRKAPSESEGFTIDLTTESKPTIYGPQDIDPAVLNGLKGH